MIVDLNVVLFLASALGVAVVYWKFGPRWAAGAAGVAAAAILLLRKKPVVYRTLVVPPPPDVGTKAVHDAAVEVVTTHAEAERKDIQDAAKDGPSLAAHLRKMK